MTETLLDLDPRVSFAEWFDSDMSLTPTEARIVSVFGQYFGIWLPGLAIVRAVYRETHHPDLTPFEVHTLRVHIMRIRRKLASTPWAIETHTGHGRYRLVERS